MGKKSSYYDVIVLGAGPVGMVAALSLCRVGLRCALIDRKDLKAESGQGRFLMLSKASVIWLQQQGLLPVPDPFWSLSQALIVRQDCPESFRIAAQEVGLDRLGSMVHEAYLKKILLQHCLAQPLLDLLHPWTLTDLTHTLKEVTVRLQNQQLGSQNLRAALCIGADGQNSWVKRLCGHWSHRYDFGQQALSFSVGYCGPEEALELFLNQGCLGVLPLSKHTAGVIWMHPQGMTDHLKQLSPQALVKKVNHLVAPYHRRFWPKGAGGIYPLRWDRSPPVIAPRVLILGEAQQSVHPLLGQGLNIALLQTAKSVSWIAGQHALGRDFGVLDKKILKISDEIPYFIYAMAEGFQRSTGALNWELFAFVAEKFPVVKNFFLKKACYPFDF